MSTAQEKIRQWIGDKSEILFQITVGIEYQTIYTISRYPSEDGNDQFYLTRCFNVRDEWKVSEDTSSHVAQKCFDELTDEITNEIQSEYDELKIYNEDIIR